MGKFTEEWNKLKPKRPKRPMKAFTRFITTYNELVGTDAKKGKTLFQDAAETWQSLTEMEKAMYEDRDAVATYKTKLANYKATMAAMKEPPTAYALFVRFYWKNKNLAYHGDRTVFGNIAERISNEWRDLDETERKVYKASADLLQALFQAEQAAVLGKKRAFNVGWQDAGLTALEGALYKEQREKPKEVDKEEDQPQPDDKEKDNITASMDTTNDDEDDEYTEKFEYGMEED